MQEFVTNSVSDGVYELKTYHDITLFIVRIRDNSWQVRRKVDGKIIHFTGHDNTTKYGAVSSAKRLLRKLIDESNVKPSNQSHTRPTELFKLTVSQAYDILGLQLGAGDNDIRAAHKKLIVAVHPDRGGSEFLAKQINAAKDFLLMRA